MSPRPKRRYEVRLLRLRGNDGFTLVETLVAFTVMAMLLSVLFRGVVMMRSGAVAFDKRTHEELVARSVWNDTIANRELRNGTTSGLRDGYRWTLMAKPFDVSTQLGVATAAGLTRLSGPNAGTSSASATTPAADVGPVWIPQRLIVRVETEGRPVEMETIRLVKAP